MAFSAGNAPVVDSFRGRSGNEGEPGCKQASFVCSFASCNARHIVPVVTRRDKTVNVTSQNVYSVSHRVCERRFQSSFARASVKINTMETEGHNRVEICICKLFTR